MTITREQATRDRLAKAIEKSTGGSLNGRSSVDVAKELLPLVAELVREGQAEALEAAAVQADLAWGSPFAHVLRARAAALRTGGPA